MNERHKELIKLQQEVRKTLIKQANRQAKKLIEILKRYEADILRELLKEAGTFQGFRLRKILEKIKERTKELEDEISQSLNENTKETFKISVEEAQKLLKESFKLSDKEKERLQNLYEEIPEEALLFLEEYNLQLAGDLSKDLYKKIKQKLQKGVLAGKRIPDIAKEIYLEKIPSIPPFKNPYDRAKTIARTETARAFHNGHILSYKKFGVEEIIIICGKSPCEICLSHCDTIHKIDYADEVLKHPNCTCTFAPIKRKKILADEKYYEDKKALTEKKEWTLKTAKGFYKAINDKFKNVKTKKEAVEIFKGLFVSEKEFYKHVRRHILEEIYELEVDNWRDAKQLDEKHNGKFSKEYFSLFAKTLIKFHTLIYQKRENTDLDRCLIYSKLHSVAIVLKGNRLITVMYNIDRNTRKKRNLEEFLRKEKEKGEILRVGADYEIREIVKLLQKRVKRFI